MIRQQGLNFQNLNVLFTRSKTLKAGGKTHAPTISKYMKEHYENLSLCINNTSHN